MSPSTGVTGKSWISAFIWALVCVGVPDSFLHARLSSTLITEAAPQSCPCLRCNTLTCNMLVSNCGGIDMKPFRSLFRPVLWRQGLWVHACDPLLCHSSDKTLMTGPDQTDAAAVPYGRDTASWITVSPQTVTYLTRESHE